MLGRVGEQSPGVTDPSAERQRAGPHLDVDGPSHGLVGVLPGTVELAPVVGDPTRQLEHVGIGVRVHRSTHVIGRPGVVGPGHPDARSGEPASRSISQRDRLVEQSAGDVEIEPGGRHLGTLDQGRGSSFVRTAEAGVEGGVQRLPVSSRLQGAVSLRDARTPGAQPSRRRRVPP